MRADLLISRVLCEDRLPALHQKWGKTLNFGHDQHEWGDTPPERVRRATINHIAQRTDPTPNKEYTDRLLSWYHKGQFRLEDSPRIHSALQSFHALRRNFGPEHAQQAGLDIKNPKDIGSYKSLHDLEHMVRTHSQSGTAVLSPEEHRDIEHGSKVIHDSLKLRVREIHTKAAAIALGRGTEWCTAHPDDRHNRFSAYNGLGKLYHIHDKETGDVHQVHFESGQIMDKHDKDADVAALTKKHPVLVDLFHGRHAEIFTDRKRLLSDVAKDPQRQINYTEEPRDGYYGRTVEGNAGGYLGRSSKDPDELHQIALHGNWAAKHAAAENPLTQSHTLEHLATLPSAKLAEKVASHQSASAKALSNVIDTVDTAYQPKKLSASTTGVITKEDRDRVLHTVGLHKNTDLRTRLKLMKSDNSDVAAAALQGSRSANQDRPPMDKHPELLDAAIKHPSSWVQSVAASHPNLTVDHMRRMTSNMKRLGTYAAKTLASRKDLPVDVQHKLAKHWDTEVTHELLANRDLHPEVVTKLSQSRDSGTVARAIYHHALPDEDRKAAVKKFPHLADHAGEYYANRASRRHQVTWRHFGGQDWDWMDLD